MIYCFSCAELFYIGIFLFFFLDPAEEIPSTAIFGQALETLCEKNPSSVPHVVSKCIEYLEVSGMATAGIFRVGGSVRKIDELRKMFDSGENVVFPENQPHVVAGLLKAFFREMKEPLLTFKLFRLFLKCQGKVLLSFPHFGFIFSIFLDSFFLLFIYTRL